MSPDAPPLWQIAIDRIVEIHEDVIHPVDKAKVVWWLRELSSDILLTEREQKLVRPTPKRQRTIRSSGHGFYYVDEEIT